MFSGCSKVNFRVQKNFSQPRNSQPSASTLNSFLLIASPKCMRSRSCEYYKQKCNCAVELVHNMSDKTSTLEVAGVLNVNNIKPIEIRKPVRWTQVCGSMAGENPCECYMFFDKKKSIVRFRRKTE